MSLTTRLKRLEKLARTKGIGCPECGGHGRIQFVIEGKPTGEGCSNCGQALRIEINRYQPGDEKRLGAGLPEELIGSAALSGMGLGW